MLQQTQVDTVIPYYTKWLNRYPTITAVANTDLEALLKIWEGLGYYQRCRNFWLAAQEVRDRFNRQIPEDSHTFRALPGVGDYTTAAVCSIAFKKPLPVIDGNVRRFMARFLGLRTLTPYNRKRILRFLERQISHELPGDFNQAMMEIGATICKPKTPLCKECPVRKECHAFTSGKPEFYPEKAAKKEIPVQKAVIGLLWKGDKFLIARRDDKRHLGGLWELPGGKMESGEMEGETLVREFKEECAVDVIVGKRVGQVKHTYSHFQVHLTLYHCFPKNGAAVISDQPIRWIMPEQIGDFPFPGATHKLFALCDQQEWKRD